MSLIRARSASDRTAAQCFSVYAISRPHSPTEARWRLAGPPTTHPNRFERVRAQAQGMQESAEIGDLEPVPHVIGQQLDAGSGPWGP